MRTIKESTIKAAAEGDESAFESLYRASSGLVYNTALRIVNNRETAAEVTQEVFLAVFRKLPGFNYKASFKTWVYRITANTAINHAGKAMREQGRAVQLHQETLADQNAKPAEDLLDRRHQRRLLSRLLAALNPDQRACIVLRNIEGLSYREIAAALDININTVRSRLKRAREKLLALRAREVQDAM